MPARRCEPGRRKKKRIVNPELSKILVFLDGLSLSRLCTPQSLSGLHVVFHIQQRIAFGSAAFGFYLFPYFCGGMLYDGFRVKAVRRRGKSKALSLCPNPARAGRKGAVQKKGT